jgi:serine protease AprX
VNLAWMIAAWAGVAQAGAEIGPGHGEAGRWWVFFADRGLDSPEARRAALAQAQAALTPRARERRMLRRTAPGLVDERDVPIPGAYLAAVMGAGADIHVQSRWLGAASVRADAATVERLRSLPMVARVEPVRTGRRTEPAPRAPGGAWADGFHGLAEHQLNQVGITALHDLGYTGAGVIVAVLDTGFILGHAAFNQPGHAINVVDAWDFVNSDPDVGIEPGDVPGQHWHGTAILGVLGAYLPGELVGGAFDAGFVLCKTEDIGSETPIEEDNYAAGLEFAESLGADVATSSLGYIDWYTQDDLDGQTAVTSIAVNAATDNGMHCCTAAGNGGHDSDPATSTLVAPADAFRVLACGAVSSEGSIVGFSSSGPTADGRVKPELLAMGADTATVDPDSAGGYMQAAGTSLSTPIIASAVACIVQARPEWTVDQVRTYLMATGNLYRATGAPDPLFVRGYGIPAAAAALAGDCNANGIPDADEIASGAAHDCDANGVPDECDIAFGTLPDADGDGVPDTCPPCRADCNRDGAINILDFLCFQGLITTGDPAADCNGDGAINVFDFLCFQGLVTKGCG